MARNIGFVSTRFAGTDGVSLEASKWGEVFAANGHACYWFAGKLEKQNGTGHLCPEAFFQHPDNCCINDRIFGYKRRTPQVTEEIHNLRGRLKTALYAFIERFDISLLVAQNVLTIPMHVPLGLALTEVIAETGIPAIAHHHDFYWERLRFSINAVNDYIRTAFPPNLPDIHHVVINSEAREQLALRAGITSTVIPNVLDFKAEPTVDRERAAAFKRSLGLAADDIMILQPTRIVQRKGIEHAIELVRELDDPRCKLVISHEAGDEGFEYADWLRDYAHEKAVDLRILTTQISDPWSLEERQEATYSLWDVYPFADFITYPSLYEGFGNAFLEAIYFRKPILVNRYATFVRDIEPLGFDLVVMDGYLTRNTVSEVRTLMDSPARREQMVAHNYEVASRHYSYSLLICRLNAIFADIFGPDSGELLKPTGECSGLTAFPASPAIHPAAAAMR